MVGKKLVRTRSQAESYIRLGKVSVNGRIITKPGFFTSAEAAISLDAPEQYVGRAGMKIASASAKLGLEWDGKTVLDVGSSTGGFTDFALRRGARKVVAVDVGTNQMDKTLRRDPRVELHEKTDIRDFIPAERPDIIMTDVSFISLREILPHLAARVAGPATEVVAMVKPQFEAGKGETARGVVKNETERRRILKDFESWAKAEWLVVAKADSAVVGAHGNRERFYKLRLAK
jgi:23S rRNA (cytidine1920-2'-O)/16S rRNA (cytidine1409-2'-O)-methyltransferase